MISLIVARARNGAIGKDNDIPWFAPEDLKSFQRETMGGAVIMGRRTWQSLPVTPLKNRLNVVVSSDPNVSELSLPSVESAINYARGQGCARIYGIGGAGIYRAMLPIADRLVITEVDLDISEADAFFPNLEARDWREIGRYMLRKNTPACEQVEYLRHPK